MGALLSGSIFEIPAYQREYAWEEGEISEFWGDIIRAAPRGPYFLGLIILTGIEKRKQVVDGQQRLLTVTVLSAALRHQAIKIGRKALADRIQTNLLRSMDYATDEMIPRIILTDEAANETLQEVVENGQRDDRVDPKDTSSSGNLRRAYQFFHKKLDAGDQDAQFKQLGSLAAFINDQLYVASFEHPSESSAYNVFEVINTRGKQLTTADLLKNYVLRETPEGLRDERYGQWQRMTRQFEKLGSRNFVQYIRHVVNLEAGYVLPKELYDYIARRGEFAGRSLVDVDNLMAALEGELALYLQLVDPTLDGPADNDDLGIFVAFNELGVTAVRPLILAIAKTEDATTGMLAVLRLVVRKMVVGNLGASSVERKFADAAKKVQETTSWREGITELADLDADREEFVAQLARRSYNRGILTFIRRSIVSSSETPESVGTLQYLRPRQIAAESWPGFTDDEAAFWFSTLGNSILTNLDRRPRQASTWTGVKDHLLPNALPVERLERLRNYDDWTPDAVAEVGLELARMAADVWY